MQSADKLMFDTATVPEFEKKRCKDSYRNGDFITYLSKSVSYVVLLYLHYWLILSSLDSIACHPFISPFQFRMDSLLLSSCHATLSQQSSTLMFFHKTQMHKVLLVLNLIPFFIKCNVFIVLNGISCIEFLIKFSSIFFIENEINAFLFLCFSCSDKIR